MLEPALPLKYDKLGALKGGTGAMEVKVEGLLGQCYNPVTKKIWKLIGGLMVGQKITSFTLSRAVILPYFQFSVSSNQINARNVVFLHRQFERDWPILADR